jgi:hypothetical protein
MLNQFVWDPKWHRRIAECKIQQKKLRVAKSIGKDNKKLARPIVATLCS